MKYLIINPFGIGDVLFTTPVIKAIKNTQPEAFVGYWCNERVVGILNDNPHINKIFALSRGDVKKIYRKSWVRGIIKSWGLFSSIKRERFDVSLDFSLDHRYSLVSKLSGIPRRIGFDYRNRGRFLTQKLSIDGYQDKHAVDYYLGLLDFLKIKAQDNKLQLFVNQKTLDDADKLCIDLGIKQNDLVVAIAPGAGISWGKAAFLKHWPAEKFAELADKIIDNFNSKVLILGDVSERPIAQILINIMKNKAIDLVGKTTLKELVALIKKSGLLITNDGGPLHIAAALGVKTVSIFGPVDERVYGPYPASARHIVISKEIGCRPCYRGFRLTPCYCHKECLNLVDTQEVLMAVKKLLN